MTDLTPSRLRELLAAATPGDWTRSGVRQSGIDWYGHAVGPDGFRIALVSYSDKEPGEHEQSMADVELLAASKALAARVIEQDAELERLREALRLIAAAHPSEKWGAESDFDAGYDTALRENAEIARAALKGDE